MCERERLREIEELRRREGGEEVLSPREQGNYSLLSTLGLCVSRGESWVEIICGVFVGLRFFELQRRARALLI